MVGMILQTQGKTAEAQARYERVVQIDPQAAVAANNLAWLYAEQGQNLQTAAQLAQSARSALPDVAAVNDTLGFVYLKQNLPDLAIDPLRDAAQKEPGNPVYQYRLGVAYSKAGRPDEARQSLEQALKLKPDFPGADDTRRILAANPNPQPGTGGR